MEVSETLRKAWSAVEDAALPDKIHEAAFREAVRLLVPAPVAAAPAAPAPGTPAQTGQSEPTGGDAGASGSVGGSSNGTDGKIAEAEEAILSKVEAQTGVDRAKLAEVVHLDDGVLKVSIPGIKLGKNNAEKTRAIAQIITMVRGFGLDESETSVELIRAEAQRLKCYDQANFSSQFSKLNGYLITGPSTNRRIRAKAAGIQAFPALIGSLLGES